MKYIMSRPMSPGHVLVSRAMAQVSESEGGY